MSKIMVPPKRPVADWEQQRDVWVQCVESLVVQIEQWSDGAGWTCRRDLKTITEETLGTYETPVLLIHAPQGRLILDPIAKNIIGAEGRVDLCVFPSYDGWPILAVNGGWKIYPNNTQGPGIALDGVAFLDAARQLLQQQ